MKKVLKRLLGAILLLVGTAIGVITFPVVFVLCFMFEVVRWICTGNGWITDEDSIIEAFIVFKVIWKIFDKIMKL